MESDLTIGIDLGGTKVAAALVATDGKVVASRRRPTVPEHGADQILRDVSALVSELGGEHSDHAVLRVGIGVAGQVDPLTGTVRSAPNLGWRDVPVATRLGEVLQLPIAVLNDVQAAAYGEWRYGAGRGVQDLLTIFVGTGIGGGIIADGLLLRGCSGSAGEVGHMTVQLGGPVCRCGNRGCLEALAGGWAIAQRARDAVSEELAGARAILALVSGDLQGISAETVVGAAEDGNALAAGILRDAGDALAAGASSLVNVLNPCVLVLGGGVVDGYPLLVERVRQAVATRSLPSAGRAVTVERARLGAHAGVIGAAAWANDSGRLGSDKTSSCQVGDRGRMCSTPA